MKFCSLFSGSSGNCLFIEDKGTRILVDAGKNGKQVELALNNIGETAKDLNGIVLTHEHSDHISAAGVLSRRYDLPLYATADTWGALEGNLGKLKDKNQVCFDKHVPFDIGSLNLTAFKTSHDAVDSVGFNITNGAKSIGIATDTGIITDDMQQYLNRCNLVVLESNHDINMLETGPYPYYLKQRIRGAWGHLSNERAAEYAKDLVLSGTDHLILAHLSEHNNLPVLAELETTNVLKKNLIKTGKDVILEVAYRNRVSQLHSL